MIRSNCRARVTSVSVASVCPWFDAQPATLLCIIVSGEATVFGVHAVGERYGMKVRCSLLCPTVHGAGCSEGLVMFRDGSLWFHCRRFCQSEQLRKASTARSQWLWRHHGISIRIRRNPLILRFGAGGWRMPRCVGPNLDVFGKLFGYARNARLTQNRVRIRLWLVNSASSSPGTLGLLSARLRRVVEALPDFRLGRRAHPQRCGRPFGNHSPFSPQASR